MVRHKTWNSNNLKPIFAGVTGPGHDTDVIGGRAVRKYAGVIVLKMIDSFLSKGFCDDRSGAGSLNCNHWPDFGQIGYRRWPAAPMFRNPIQDLLTVGGVDD